MSKQIYIGTSGWSYDSWRKVFYPEGIKSKERLPFYSQHFQSVEINSTYYHLPSEGTVQNWHDQVPKHFIFSIKASRYITQVKRLKDEEGGADKFFNAIRPLKSKMGPILFQLSPSFKANLERLEEFVSHLPKKKKAVFEFRHPSWFDDRVYSILNKYASALCISDLNGILSPLEVTADFVYLRLHGPKEAYKGSYSKKELQDWLKAIEHWHQKKLDIFLYFDNDEKGFAAQNAKQLKQMVHATSA